LRRGGGDCGRGTSSGGGGDGGVGKKKDVLLRFPCWGMFWRVLLGLCRGLNVLDCINGDSGNRTWVGAVAVTIPEQR